MGTVIKETLREIKENTELKIQAITAWIQTGIVEACIQHGLHFANTAGSCKWGMNTLFLNTCFHFRILCLYTIKHKTIS